MDVSIIVQKLQAIDPRFANINTQKQVFGEPSKTNITGTKLT